MYGWSKHGGANHGLVMEDLPEWTCQACASKQTLDLPAYMIPEDEYQREFFRICSKCKSRMLKLGITTMPELLEQTPKPDIYRFANLR